MSRVNQFVLDYKVIPATGVRSLVWIDGELVDCVCGNVVYGLDASKRNATVKYPYRFDAAVASPSGGFIALYERLGTKAVILGPNHLCREINRSYYLAHVYEYPILFFQMADGREALAHCPEQYCDLQIEDPGSGIQLSLENTNRQDDDDFFHSRLAVNPTGTRMLSAGWIWHPFDSIKVYDLCPLTDGQLNLETRAGCLPTGTEISSAVFRSDGQLVVTSNKDARTFHHDQSGKSFRPGTIAVFNLDEDKLTSVAPLGGNAGTIFAVGNQYILGMYDHPKLIEVSTGRIVCEWPELKSGEQSSSVLSGGPLPPPIAYDVTSGRLAVADNEKITVVSLNPMLLR